MGKDELIEDEIVAGCEGFFDEPNIRHDLHVTIRIARDFHNFLLKFGGTPPTNEIDYIVGTIRSGMDEFFSLAYVCTTINTGGKAWAFDPHRYSELLSLREDFLRGFEDLADSEQSDVERLVSLLRLTHLELVFLARHFPSAIFSNISDSPDVR